MANNPPEPVRTTVGFRPPSSSGGGDVTDGANVGGEAEVFRNKVGTILNFRTLRGVNGATVTENGDVLDIDGGGGLSPIQSASFADNTTLDLVVGATATDGTIMVDMSLLDTVTSAERSVRWTLAVTPTTVDSDRPFVESGGTLDVEMSSLASGPDAICRLTGIGAGNLIEVRYRVTVIPRI